MLCALRPSSSVYTPLLSSLSHTLRVQNERAEGGRVVQNNFHIRVILRKKGAYKLSCLLERHERGARFCCCFHRRFIVVSSCGCRRCHHHHRQRVLSVQKCKKEKKMFEEEMVRGSICTMSRYKYKISMYVYMLGMNMKLKYERI